MAASTQIEALSSVIVRDFAVLERRLEPKVDGIFRRLHTTSDNVTSSGLGQTFQAHHVFATGLAGAFKNVSALGPATQDLANTPHSTMYAEGTTFHTIDQVTGPAFVERTLQLVQGMGSYALPIHVLQAQMLRTMRANVVALMNRGTAKRVAQHEAIQMYIPSSGGQEVAGGNHNQTQAIVTLPDVSDAVADGPLANQSVTITLNNVDAIGRIGYIMPGTLLDLHSSAGTKKNNGADAGGGALNPLMLIVGAVDYLNGTFNLHSVSSTGAQYLLEHDVDFADGDYLVLAESGGTGLDGFGPSGLHRWLVDSGTVFGINLANYPQFKSLVSVIGGPVDQFILNQKIGLFHDAYDDLAELDTIITTAGITNMLMENQDGFQRFDLQGKALKVNFGWAEIAYTYMGMDFDWLISRYMPYGYLDVVKTRDQNIKRYQPPPINGASGSEEGYMDWVQWLNLAAGQGTIFNVAKSTSGANTQYLEAPFYGFRENAPVSMQGIKLTGISSSF